MAVDSHFLNPVLLLSAATCRIHRSDLLRSCCSLVINSIKADGLIFEVDHILMDDFFTFSIMEMECA